MRDAESEDEELLFAIEGPEEELGEGPENGRGEGRGDGRGVDREDGSGNVPGEGAGAPGGREAREGAGGIGVITFNRPAARNALTFDMYDALGGICDDVAAGHVAVRALILTGAGERAFAAGTDISRFRDFRTAEDALGYERRMDRVLEALERVPVPTVAAIRGACTGGGAAIAACCDLRVASPDLAFGFPIARTLGNCLSVGNLSRLVELLGAPLTREIILTARLVRAEEARRVGLVGELVDEPMARARELARTMAGYAPLTLAATKEGLRRLREHAADVDGDDLIVRCYTSEDFREGMEAFLAKRAPAFRGR